MLQAFPTHHQNTSQRQGAILRVHISPDTNPYHVTDITTGLSIKEHNKKPYQIAHLLQECLRDYLQSAYPDIPKNHIKFDSYQPDKLNSPHVLKVKMHAKHMKAWLDIIQILEPLQGIFHILNNRSSPYAFNINSPVFEFEEGESALRYKLAKLKARIASLLPYYFKLTSQEQWKKVQMLYAHQDFIHDALLPTGFKAIR
ncbi:MAG: hypothetical protein ACK551_06395 [Vampirovibrionales bacterium]